MENATLNQSNLQLISRATSGPDDIRPAEGGAEPSTAAAFPRQFRNALDELSEELARIPAAKLVAVNRDVTAAAIVAIGAAPEVRRFRAEMVAQFGEEKASLVDRLEMIARAAAAAQGQHEAFSTGEDLLPLAEAVRDVRANLVAEVQSLISRRRIAKSALDRLRQSHGYRSQIADVLLLVSVLQHAWPSISGVTGLKLADLHHAEAVANELATAVGFRDQGAASSTADLRQRAFTHLVRTYDGIRRMITYLRWEEGDADRIAPSFYAGRKGRRRLGELEAKVETTGSDVEQPDDAGMLGGNPFANA